MRSLAPLRRRPGQPGGRTRQRGVAVLLAIFITTLATILVADLLWRQFALFRTIENERLAAQSRLLVDGAMEWAELLLLDQQHPAYDTLSDPWAQPLAETPLDQLGNEMPTLQKGSVEGGIEDAQARYNLRNLLQHDGQIDPAQLAALEKLVALVRAPAGSAQAIANYVALAYAPLGSPGGGSQGAEASQGASTRPMPPVLAEDLAGVPGLDPMAAQILGPYVVMLDQVGSTVNFNTARPEVMAAVIPDLSLSDAIALASERDRAYFVSVADVQNRLHGRGGNVTLSAISTNSSCFIVRGAVHLDRAVTREHALLRRTGVGAQAQVLVIWRHDD